MREWVGLSVRRVSEGAPHLQHRRQVVIGGQAQATLAEAKALREHCSTSRGRGAVDVIVSDAEKKDEDIHETSAHFTVSRRSHIGSER